MSEPCKVRTSCLYKVGRCIYASMDTQVSPCSHHPVSAIINSWPILLHNTLTDSPLPALFWSKSQTSHHFIHKYLFVIENGGLNPVLSNFKDCTLNNYTLLLPGEGSRPRKVEWRIDSICFFFILTTPFFTLWSIIVLIFSDEETEAQRSSITCPRSHKEWGTESGFKFWFSDSTSHSLSRTSQMPFKMVLKL